MNLNQFCQLPLMGILRGVSLERIDELAEAVICSGLKTLEVTMNTPFASSIIKAIKKNAAGRITLGAGTVLDVDSLKEALDSGATFIVSPTFIPEVVDYCCSKNIPVFPGALTPQEIYNAYSAGASMVKVFPSKFFGPDYFKEIKGPFQNVKLLACGGVTPDNMGSFFSKGADSIAFGASVFKAEWLQTKSFKLIGDKLKVFIDTFLKMKGDKTWQKN